MHLLFTSDVFPLVWNLESQSAITILRHQVLKIAPLFVTNCTV